MKVKGKFTLLDEIKILSALTEMLWLIIIYKKDKKFRWFCHREMLSSILGKFKKNYQASLKIDKAW